MSEQRPPSKLYKYQPVGPHMGLNLVMALQKRAYFFAAPSVLNDPADCHPSLPDFYDKEVLVDALGLISTSKEVDENTKSLADQHLKKVHELDPLEAGGLLGILHDPGFQSRNFINDLFEQRLGSPQVLSLTEEPTSTRMWSHYAGSHSGFCIELSGLNNLPSEVHLKPVGYTSRRSQISASEVILTSDKRAITELLQRLYFEKSLDWSYEHEWRFVCTDRSVPNKELELPEGDFVCLPGVWVSGIIFGLRCPDVTRGKIAAIISKYCSSPSQVKFFVARQSSTSYVIEIDEYRNDVYPPGALGGLGGLGGIRL